VVAPGGTVATIEVALQLVIVVAVVPLNVTELVPCVVPKFAPAIVTDAPTAPEVGDRLVMLGAATTVNEEPLLFTALTFTTTLPVVAPVGTTATIEVAPQLVIVAVVPLNATVLVPCVVPKFVPVIVTGAPTVPDEGDKLVMLGASTTINEGALLANPPTVTVTFPVVAPVGTVATIEVAPQLVVVVAAVPLKVTVLVPWLEPKPIPAIVTDAPTVPDVGDSVVMCGTTVKFTPLLPTPPTVTTTLPVAAVEGTATVIEPALQLVGVAAVPLNITVLVPWLEPKLLPVIVTLVPAAPLVGDRLVMLGATVKLNPLLAVPPTVTTTLPLVAPEGTVATIEVGLQPVAVAAVPLNVTVLVPCVASKFVPAIVTDVPTGPELGDKPVMLGPVPGTVKLTLLLTVPLAVTTTLPLVAPVGTGTLI